MNCWRADGGDAGVVAALGDESCGVLVVLRELMELVDVGESGGDVLLVSDEGVRADRP